jgi:hypothetical protein
MKVSISIGVLTFNGSRDGSLIHIHNNHDLSNWVVIICVKGKNGKKDNGRCKQWQNPVIDSKIILQMRFFSSK